MAKTLFERMRDALTAKQQAQADADRRTKTLIQQATDKQRAAIEQATKFLPAALEEAKTALTEKQYTADVGSCVISATVNGYMLTVRGPGPLAPTHCIIFNYVGARIHLDDRRPQRMQPFPTTKQAASDLVFAALHQLGVV